MRDAPAKWQKLHEPNPFVPIRLKRCGFKYDTPGWRSSAKATKPAPIRLGSSLAECISHSLQAGNGEERRIEARKPTRIECAFSS